MDNKVTDPVCGMQLEPSKAAAESNYQGRTYYFCSQEDKMKFDEDPRKYLDKNAPTEHRQ